MFLEIQWRNFFKHLKNVFPFLIPNGTKPYKFFNSIEAAMQSEKNKGLIGNGYKTIHIFFNGFKSNSLLKFYM